MGSLHLSSCPSCGHEAQVSGGLDFGMTCVIHTVSCPRCQKLSDTVVSDRPGGVVVHRLQADGEEDPDVLRGTVPERPRCAIDGRYAAQRWDHPGSCPRCGRTLVRGDMAMSWD